MNDWIIYILLWSNKIQWLYVWDYTEYTDLGFDDFNNIVTNYNIEEQGGLISMPRYSKLESKTVYRYPFGFEFLVKKGTEKVRLLKLPYKVVVETFCFYLRQNSAWDCSKIIWQKMFNQMVRVVCVLIILLIDNGEDGSCIEILPRQNLTPNLVQQRPNSTKSRFM